MIDLYPQLSTRTPGALLSAAREEAGLTLADVAARSRVPMASLAAIESDDYQALPAVTYARGFLRLYAREVGLDPERIVALYGALQARTQTPTAEYTPYVTSARRDAVSGRRGNPVFGVAVGAVVTAIVLALLWSPTDGVDQAQMGSEFSKGAVELPTERP
jgi:cytoskeletal protein RodZ